jgi:hypothetical protein
MTRNGDRPAPSFADLPSDRRRWPAHRRNRAKDAATAAEAPAMTASASSTASRIAALEELVSELFARLAVMEAGQRVREDGPPRRTGRWLRTKAAAKATGYSVSGLKKLCRQGRVVFDDDAPRRLINIDTVPVRVPKVAEVPSGGLAASEASTIPDLENPE